MSRSPDPSSSSSSVRPSRLLSPPSGRSTGIVLLSPRQSPTPDPPAARADPLLVDPASSSATPPPPQEPPTDSLVHGTADAGGDGGARELVREIARREGREPEDGMFYDAEGQLRPLPSTSSFTNMFAFGTDDVAPPPSALSNHSVRPLLTEDYHEEADQEALFVSSLEAGEESFLRRRQRGRRAPSTPPLLGEAGEPPLSAYGASGAGNEEGVGGMDLLTEDTGWVFIPGTAGAGAGGDPPVPEISPEEERARRMMQRGRESVRTAAEGGWDGSAWAAEEAYLRRAEQEMNAADRARRGDESSIWRNDLLSVPRTSALPRGGRFYPSATASSSTSTFSPSNPPAVAANLSDRTYRILGTQLDYTTRGDLLPSPVHERSAQFGLPPARTPPAPAPAPEPADDIFNLDSAWHSPFNMPYARTSPALPSNNGAPPASSSVFSPLRPRPEVYVPPSNWSSSGGGIPQNPSPPRRRTREETNALMGHALRAKKGVYLLYCGGGDPVPPSSSSDEALPPGFSYAAPVDGPDGTDPPRSGCGALICARALLDGVPSKVFSDEDARAGRERAAASSDLPPSAARVVDWDAAGRGDGEGGGGERVGRRGWKGCKGCVTRDVGCKRCGNHLGYRLLRPCVTCSIARPSYTTYANVVSSSADPPRSPGGGTPLTLSAGGVTGGGVVDGLLFHFRLDAVTPLERLVGVRPAEEVEGERRARVVRGKRRAREEEREEREREREQEELQSPGRRAQAVRRLVEKVPGEGEPMLWRHVPSAQRDFLDSLLGEPGDWITPAGETWWLDNAVAKHTQRGSGGGGRGTGAGGRKRSAVGAFGVDAHSSDRLSTAATTVDASTGTSSLSRSGAIRHRIPLAGSSSSSSSPSSSSFAPTATTGAGPADEYDRFRADAADFQRRVRQRLADPSASEEAAGGGGVVGGLERAGYGSGFVDDEEEEEEEEPAMVLSRRRVVSVGGRGGRRESVGR
ncbi:hypothetical protein JCM6882_002145 [Rhodosporidiobolus microsporus]